MVVVGRVSEAPVATSLPLVWTIYVRNEWIVVQTDDGKDRMVVEDVVKEKDGERDAPRPRNLMKLYAHTAFLFEGSLK